MEADGLNRGGEWLAAEVAGCGRGELGKRWRCPARLKSRIVAYARQCREVGETLADIAVRLGLVESTLGRWIRRERAEETAVGFRSVSIVPVAPAHGGGAGRATELTRARISHTLPAAAADLLASTTFLAAAAPRRASSTPMPPRRPLRVLGPVGPTALRAVREVPNGTLFETPC